MTQITEQEARDVIARGAAGYYEIRPRDSISKSPIAHSLQTAVYASGGWYLLPKEEFVIVDLGMVRDGPLIGRAQTVEFEADHPIGALLQADVERYQIEFGGPKP